MLQTGERRYVSYRVMWLVHFRSRPKPLVRSCIKISEVWSTWRHPKLAHLYENKCTPVRINAHFVKNAVVNTRRKKHIQSRSCIKTLYEFTSCMWRSWTQIHDDFSEYKKCVSGRQKRCFQSQNTYVIFGQCRSWLQIPKSRFSRACPSWVQFWHSKIIRLKTANIYPHVFETKTRKFGTAKIFRFTVIGVFSCRSMDYPMHIRYIVGAMEVTILYFKELPDKIAIKWLILSLKLVLS